MTYVQRMTGNDTSQGVGGDTLASCKDSGGREGGIESVESGASEAKEHHGTQEHLGLGFQNDNHPHLN